MQKVVFKTYGCSNNFSESEAMAGILIKEGFKAEESNEFDSADIIVFNMCSVKGPSVNHCLNSIKKLLKKNPKKRIVVAGCVPKETIKQIKLINEKILVVNTHNIEHIFDAIKKEKNFISFKKKIKLNYPKKRINKIVGIIPILSGCNDFCSYCSTKLIKGSLVSFPEKQILEEVKTALDDGCKEIWVTSQDNGAYGTENGKSKLPDLINKITLLEGNFLIRIGMTNPTYILESLSELIQSFKNKKVFKFLHVPVQSGNNEILKKMNRRYSVEGYKKIIKEFKKEFPEMTIATDIIVGFPTETKKQFQDSLDLVKETKPEVLNISRFQSRPNTLASKMFQLTGSEIKSRSRKLTNLFEEISLKNNKKWIGKICSVLIDEKGKKSNQSIGRNLSYKQVLFEEKILLGKTVKAKITDAKTFHLNGKKIS